MRPDPSTVLLHAMPEVVADDAAGHGLTLSTYRVSAGEPEPADYRRAQHPNWSIVERGLGALEDADAVLFPSGQAASHALLADLAGAHRRIVLPHDGYYNTRALGRVVGGATGVQIREVDLLDRTAVARALDVDGAVLWVETPTNPLLRIADLAALAETAERHAALMVVDNTVATAILQQPAAFGARASVYSLTKAPGGHSDLLLGAVVTRDAALAGRLRDWRTVTGTIPGVLEAWLAARSLKTLPIRLSVQCANALAIARHLQAHEQVVAVHYPGLPPHRAVAERQMTGGYGPLLSFEVVGTARTADAVVASAQLVRAGTSFGGVVSSWERRARWPAEHAPATLIRLSVGIEGVGDLIADIDGALLAAVA